MAAQSPASGSFKLATILGIPILIHFSLLLILPVLTWSIGDQIKEFAALAEIPAGSLALSPYVSGFVVSVALFVSVALHELGHSIVALRYGVRIRRITLMLFGGVAQLESMPTGPWQEAKIAAAGPAVSFGIGLACYSTAGIIPADLADLAFAVAHLGYINLVLGVFNLLPAFPMDGGRILRSVLARWYPFTTATSVAAAVGKAMAVLMGLAGLVGGNLMLVLVAFFVYIGASQEKEFTTLKTTLDGLRVRDLMTSDVSAVSPSLPVEELLDKMLRERHTGYPVVHQSAVVGCVTFEDVTKVSAEDRRAAVVEDIMSRDAIMVRPDEDAYVALNRMSQEEIGRLPVVDDGRLVGIVSRTDIVRGFRLRQARAGMR